MKAPSCPVCQGEHFGGVRNCPALTAHKAKPATPPAPPKPTPIKATPAPEPSKPAETLGKPCPTCGKPGWTPFDKRTYQRLKMREIRAKEKADKSTT